jgi:hypothetical protein
MIATKSVGSILHVLLLAAAVSAYFVGKLVSFDGVNETIAIRDAYIQWI